MRRTNVRPSQCGDQWGRQGASSCNISMAIAFDSGVYWCESDKGHVSNFLNITAVPGPVTLDSFLSLVTVGDTITLRWLYLYEIKSAYTR